jgi:glycosyltransferase involved in cell wall biosynthesis
MTQPWLSVISPIYNSERYLQIALDSILLQQDHNIECIAVDGESTDATATILHDYQNKLPLKILNRNRETNWVTKTIVLIHGMFMNPACWERSIR